SHVLFGHRHGPLALKAALYPAPLGAPPKHETEKERSAEIHTGGIAKLVSNSRVVHRINRDVMTDEQVRHRHRHECLLKHATPKITATPSSGSWKVANVPERITSDARGTAATPLLVSINVSTIGICCARLRWMPAACATNTAARER